MENKDFISLGGFVFLLLTSMIGLAITWTKQGGKIDLLNQDLQNHKENHNKLEGKVTAHESKIDERLIALDKKIDEKHELVSDKLDDLKELILKR